VQRFSLLEGVASCWPVDADGPPVGSDFLRQRKVTGLIAQPVGRRYPGEEVIYDGFSFRSKRLVRRAQTLARRPLQAGTESRLRRPHLKRQRFRWTVGAGLRGIRWER
jgi:hypothetical protein